MSRETMMQYFEWYLPSDGEHWRRLKEEIPQLQKLGITKVWMPPAFKGTGVNDVGYGVYDLFDLGEFDQNGTIRTKYGTKDDYIATVQALKSAGIMPIADIVLNHKANGDHKERFSVLKMNPANRQEPVSEPFEIEGWTGFQFPGRAGVYNDFHWHWYHFTGVDYDASHNETGIYLILGDNKGWADQQRIDTENGNYDYLMYDDIDFKHPEVVAHLKDWVRWFIETTGVTGFRLDAVKHIDSEFMADFINDIRQNINPELYAFGEYWKDDTGASERYLEAIQHEFGLVDVVLHMNFYEAGQKGREFNLASILNGSLMQENPAYAVTFVDNHDSQRGQALQSTVEEWFKPLAYGLILLRQEGTPCIFYGDYYGISGDFPQMAFKDVLDKLTDLRQQYTFGRQVDYFDHPNCIGWTLLGDEEHPHPLAVVLSNGEAGWKRMEIGLLHQGKTFVDALGNCPEKVTIGSDGWAEFPVLGGSISAWVEEC